MDLKGLGDLIAKDAPLLGAVVSTVNPAAGLLINAVAHLFGAAPGDPADIANKIVADPSAAIKLKTLELQHEEVLQANQIDDRKNARNREEEIVKLTGRPDFILNLIAITVTVGYFFVCMFTLFVNVEKASHDILFMMIGQLTAGFMMVLSYYFGSSNK